MMTYRQLIINTLRGEPTDCLPFVPRIDLWYKSNKLRGTLPTKYRAATLREIIEDLDVGFHTIAPDYQNYHDLLDVSDRALGIWRVSSLPYRAELRNIEKKVSYQGDVTTVEYMTPVGSIRTKSLYDDNMRQAGVTVSHILEHAIKSRKDYDVVGYIFENIEVAANYEHFLSIYNEVGERGIIVGKTNTGGSPMHEIMHELMPYELFVYELYDHPDELEKLAQRLELYFSNIFQVVAESPADIIYLGGNFDTHLTPPAFFRKHIAPNLIKAANSLHIRGKYLLSHTDGENKGLVNEYVNCKIDIADSICPAPMTSLTLKEIRDAFSGKVTIWGGIPSISMLENSMNDYDFEKYINDLFNQIGKGDHLILSIADTAPPDMKFSRLEYIAKLAKEFGAVCP